MRTPPMLRSALILALSLVALHARAAAIFLEPASPTVAVGSSLQVAVMGSGFDLGADGGDFFVQWSPHFSFVSFAVDDPPWDLSAIDTSEVSFGFLPGDVASFAETPGGGGVAFRIGTLTLAASQVGAGTVGVFENGLGWSLGGAFIDGVVYAGDSSIAVVAAPEPAPAWLCAIGLAFVAARARRRAANGE
jgi:hypothetical protein